MIPAFVANKLPRHTIKFISITLLVPTGPSLIILINASFNLERRQIDQIKGFQLCNRRRKAAS